MADTLKITPTQFKAFKKVGRPDLVDKIDHWLCAELEGWNRAQVEQRHLIIDEICDAADDAEFDIEMDFAMLCYVVLRKRSQWRAWLYGEPCQAILAQRSRNPSAKVREMYIRSEAYAG